MVVALVVIIMNYVWSCRVLAASVDCDVVAQNHFKFIWTQKHVPIFRISSSNSSKVKAIFGPTFELKVIQMQTLTICKCNCFCRLGVIPSTLVNTCMLLCPKYFVTFWYIQFLLADFSSSPHLKSSSTFSTIDFSVHTMCYTFYRILVT